jgi:hypothetical protein
MASYNDVKYRRTVPTPEEIAEHVERYGRRPGTYRYECRECGKRLWGSGLGLGAHNRSKACLDAWLAARDAE